MIHIEDILEPQQILMGLKAQTKTEVLCAMIDRLAEMQSISNPDRVLQNLLERERLMTTGVKKGFAFPHTFSPQFNQTFLSLGVVPDGVDYESLDGEPVEFVFLLLGPPDHQTLHLRALARISRLTGHPGMLDQLREAGSPEQIMDLLVATQHQLKTYSADTQSLY